MTSSSSLRSCRSSTPGGVFSTLLVASEYERCDHCGAGHDPADVDAGDQRCEGGHGHHGSWEIPRDFDLESDCGDGEQPDEGCRERGDDGIEAAAVAQPVEVVQRRSR